jgi:hypothetical protein
MAVMIWLGSGVNRRVATASRRREEQDDDVVVKGISSGL